MKLPLSLLLPKVNGIPILMYHRVWNGISDKLTITPLKLREQFVYLRDRGYYSLSLPEFLNAVAGKILLPSKSILLTFDDGYKTNLNSVYPLLREFGLKAVFFIIGNTINGTAVEEKDPVNQKMKLEELQKLDPLLKSEYEKMGMTTQNVFQFFSTRGDNFFKLSESFKLGPSVMSYYKCIQIEPKNPVPYNKAGKIFQYLKMNKYAEQFLRYAAYADGKNPEYFFNLGMYYCNNAEDYKAGSGCLDTAALLGSVNANLYYTNGIIKHNKLKNYTGALKDYTTALTLDPALRIAKEMRGLLKMNQLKDYKSALADFEALSKLDPKSEVYKNEVNECKEKLKK